MMFGVDDPSLLPLVTGELMGELPQTLLYIAFAVQDLANVCKAGIYEEVTTAVVANAVTGGYTVLSAFAVSHDDTER